MAMRYRRILLKLSGEALAGGQGFGIDQTLADFVAREIKSLHDAGVQIGIVLGGGNIFRGLAGAAGGMNRSAGDMIGMLATVINSLVMHERLGAIGVKSRVLSAIGIDKGAELFTRDRAIGLLEQGTVVIAAAGTGNPYFTTDTAAALRCAEMECNVLIKATKVDGIYDADPVKHPGARKISRLNHRMALEQNLRIMDSTAFSLCMENAIPIIVLKMMEKDNLLRCLQGAEIGSLVTGEQES